MKFWDVVPPPPVLPPQTDASVKDAALWEILARVRKINLCSLPPKAVLEVTLIGRAARIALGEDP